MKISALQAVLASSLAASCGPTPPAKLIEVEMWKGGDDGLTTRFEDQLRRALVATGHFSIDNPHAEDALVLLIPSNLKRTTAADGGPYAYRIEFRKKAAGLVGHSDGSCLESDLSQCVAKALRDTESVADRLAR